MSGCCNELGCRRTQPIRVVRGRLSGIWYAVTSYTEHEDGSLHVVRAKHVVAADSAAELDAAAARIAALEAERDALAGEGQSDG